MSGFSVNSISLIKRLRISDGSHYLCCQRNYREEFELGSGRDTPWAYIAFVTKPRPIRFQAIPTAWNSTSSLPGSPLCIISFSACYLLFRVRALMKFCTLNFSLNTRCFSSRLLYTVPTNCIFSLSLFISYLLHINCSFSELYCSVQHLS